MDDFNLKGDEMNKFNSIEEAIEDIKNGKMIVVVDDENRENEGDLLIPAQTCTPEIVNAMAKYGRGLICMAMTGERLNALKIGQMVANNTDAKETAFTVSVDHVSCDTGISAHERAYTISKLIDEDAKSEDFSRPGHIFPLKAKDHGVLERNGHTEAAVDLARMAGFYPAGVICEIMNDDGTMARVPELMQFVKEHDLKIITIEDLIAYKLRDNAMVIREANLEMPTKYGDFKAIGYVNKITKEHHIALIKGEIDSDEPMLMRMHSECLTGDVFGSLRCDCGDQLAEAMKRINKEGRGILIYLRQEGRGIGLINKLKAYELQDQGMDTVEANLALGFPEDLRNYTVAGQILKDLGIKNVKLMTNNPDKISGLKLSGIKISKRIAIQMNHNESNYFYLKTKKDKMGHKLNLEDNNKK